jgi:hypothetical protein
VRLPLPLTSAAEELAGVLTGRDGGPGAAATDAAAADVAAGLRHSSSSRSSRGPLCHAISCARSQPDCTCRMQKGEEQQRWMRLYVLQEQKLHVVRVVCMHCHRPAAAAATLAGLK